jgi:hypothetical protein
MYSSIAVDRHSINVGKMPAYLPPEHADALTLMAVGTPIPYCETRIADDEDREVPDGHVGHILIRGDNVTKGYFENPEANAQGYTADGWLRTGDLGMLKEGKLYITGRAKEIIFVNGQNYYPHDIENIAIRADAMELGKVVAAGIRPKHGSTDDLVIFVLHRMDMKEFLPIATQIARLVNEHTGLEVANVVPVKRIPKTTSGKIQRHLLEEDFLNGGQDASSRRSRWRAEPPAWRGHGDEQRDRAAAQTLLMPRRRIDVHGNLLKSAPAAQAHRDPRADRPPHPGLVDLTELFDFLTMPSEEAHRKQVTAAA